MNQKRSLHVLTVCGAGMGSSLILKMNTDEVLKSLDVDARVESTDMSTARGMRPDVVIAQEMHTSDLQELAPVVLTISDFMNSETLKDQLREALTEQGWISS